MGKMMVHGVPYGGLTDKVPYTSSDIADADVTIATGWTTVDPLVTGETNQSIFTKMSQMFKNVRYLYKHPIGYYGTPSVPKTIVEISAWIGSLIDPQTDDEQILYDRVMKGCLRVSGSVFTIQSNATSGVIMTRTLISNTGIQSFTYDWRTTSPTTIIRRDSITKTDGTTTISSSDHSSDTGYFVY